MADVGRAAAAAAAAAAAFASAAPGVQARSALTPANHHHRQVLAHSVERLVRVDSSCSQDSRESAASSAANGLTNGSSVTVTNSVTSPEPMIDCEDPLRRMILTIIDKLRERKARPDVDRICSMVTRHHGLRRESIVQLLERLVDEGSVLKVEYKGSVSYRNASKWKRGSLISSVLNSSATSKRLLGAVKSLVEDTPGSRQHGFTAQEIGQRLKRLQAEENDEEEDGGGISDFGDSNGPELIGDALEMALEREASTGGLFRVGVGRYVLDLDGSKRQAVMKRRKEKLAAAQVRQRPPAASPCPEVKRARPSPPAAPLPARPPPAVSPAEPLDLTTTQRLYPPPPPPQPPIHHAARPQIAAEVSHQPVPATPQAVEDHESQEESNTASVADVSVAEESANNESSCDAKMEAIDDDNQLEESHEDKQLEKPEIQQEQKKPRKEHQEVCDFCLASCEANRMGVPEQLLCCKDCNHRAHPSCMMYSAELAQRARQSPWQCSECKTCCVCMDAGDAELMLICDACDRGYHVSCHKPKIPENPEADDKWICSECAKDDRPAKRCQPFPAEDSPFDATRWTISQVRRWLLAEGFPLAAKAFVEQEIDGASLMLMKRMDVLTGLGLKLGPAVKVYERISKLQNRCRTLLRVT